MTLYTREKGVRSGKTAPGPPGENPNRCAYQLGPEALKVCREVWAGTTATASGIPFWPSRDPIGERGGLNLYAFVGTNGVNWIDILGLRPFDTAREAFDAAASAAQKATQADVNMQAPVFKRPGGAFLIGPEKNLKREFCGLVCKKCGEDGKWKWDYTDPHAGKNWFKEEAPGIAVPQPSCEPNEATCKDGWERVGTYHSQPGEATPSRADWEAALWDGLRFRTGVFVPSLGMILPEPFSIGGPDGNFHWNW